MSLLKSVSFAIAFFIGAIVAHGSAAAAVVSFSASDFGLNPTFSDVRTFSFSIDIADPIAPGANLINPTLNGVQYSVSGSLATGTPSRFPAFDLQRTIGGAEFYSQGSSFTMRIASNADLSDGLQVSELSGTDPVFVFNGREVDTGRYHPSLFQLNADGTGSLQNSNNTGGINPSSMEVVNVTIGQEYVTQLSFNPSALTIVAVPEPTAAALLMTGGVLTLLRRRRRADGE